MKTVLVVDDKEMMRDSVGSTLQRAGFAVITAENGEHALTAAAKRRPDAVVTDLKMPGLSGIELLERLREIDTELPVVLMTAFGTIETAVSAMKLGAFDYITKPFQGDELVIAVKRACQHGGLIRENAVLKAQAKREAPVAEAGDQPTGLDRLIGSSAAMRRVREQVAAVAESLGTVLVVGESGSGKEVVARAVHEVSSRRENAMLAVNCAALSESLLESELFGHEKGAFTGADQLRKGRFELADRGSLMLDEVSEIPPSLQAKLLRVLQERSFERVGSSLTIGVDVRVIATSNRDLPRSVAKGDFRQDLFFRLNVLPIHLPPLRERSSDVPELAEFFVNQISAREGVESMVFSQEALSLMERYTWPGNVRELQNICERAVVLGKAREARVIGSETIEPWLGMMGIEPTTDPSVQMRNEATAAFVEAAGGQIQTEASPYSPQTEETVPAVSKALSEIVRPDITLEELERDAIVRTLERFGGHRQKTAKSLGIGVRTLGLKLKKWKEQDIVSQSL
ncbi:MAG: sigma-54-dependent Fis family transcriptional regulator [Phycisphaera sp.]|nr:MAG: sigma-54-dependent Fis family transcriptional regulator [Phycisphaera sp.]